MAAFSAVTLPILRAASPTSHVFGTRALLLVAAVVAVEWIALLTALSIVMGGSKRRVAARVVVGAAASALVIVALEIPAALFDFDWRTLLTRQDEAFFGRIKPWKNPWNVPDPALVFRRPPNSHVQGRAHGDCVPWLGVANATEYEYDLSYDARGYRNDRTLDAAAVAVIGDSFVEAAFVPAADLFTSVLSRELGVPVMNLGVGGYGPQQELEVLRRDALPLSPKLVFWCFFEGNDLNDARRFERDRQEDRVSKAGFFSRCFTTNAAMLIARALAPPLAEDGPEARLSRGRLRVPGPDEGRSIYFPYPARPLTQGERSALSDVTGLLATAAAECRTHGAELVVVLVPEKFRVYGELCDFEEDAHPRHWQPSDLPMRMADWASKADVALVDLTGALRCAAEEGALVYFSDDGHWNTRGHEVAAAALAAAARQRQVVEAKR